MKFVSPRKVWSRGVLVLSLAALAFPMVSAGCGETRACFEWSQAKGACPARDKALPFLVAPMCAGNIASIDSEARFENDLCCYTVTKLDSEPCTMVPPPPPPPPCMRCTAAAATPNVNLGDVCADSLMVFNNLKFCACSTTCAGSCSGDFCAGTAMGAMCSACLMDIAAGCGDAWNLCVQDG